MSNLAPAVNNLVGRKTPYEYIQTRRGTVSTVSPLTVQMADGTFVTELERLPSYTPHVGDLVRIEVDGMAWTITDTISGTDGVEYRHGNTGIIAVAGGAGLTTLTFAVPFPTTCDGIVCTEISNSNSTIKPTVSSRSAATVTLQWIITQSGAVAANGSNTNVDYWAWGH